MIQKVKFILLILLSLSNLHIFAQSSGDVLQEILKEAIEKKINEEVAKEEVEISNVSYIQRDSLVMINFDLKGDYNVYIDLFYSTNDGITWHGPLKYVSGDNSFISKGKYNRIEWDVLKEQSLLISDNIQFKLVATKGKGIFIDDRDQEKYEWVRIGEQIWMNDNLRYASGKFIDNRKEWKKNEDAAYSWYEDKEYNKKRYGAFYNYKATKDACPDGWRLPTFEDFFILIKHLEHKEESKETNAFMIAFGTRNTKEKDYSNINVNNALDLISKQATSIFDYKYEVNIAYEDIYNFFDYKGGIRYSGTGEFNDEYKYNEWWSSTEINSQHVFELQSLDYREIILGQDYEDIERAKKTQSATLSWQSKGHAINIRCIKNDE